MVYSPLASGRLYPSPTVHRPVNSVLFKPFPLLFNSVHEKGVFYRHVNWRGTLMNITFWTNRRNNDVGTRSEPKSVCRPRREKITVFLKLLCFSYIAPWRNGINFFTKQRFRCWRFHILRTHTIIVSRYLIPGPQPFLAYNFVCLRQRTLVTRTNNFEWTELRTE